MNQPERDASAPQVMLGRRGAIGLLTLNRPERANAFSVIMRGELLAAAQAIAADESVRAVILTGAGRYFSAGADLREPRAVRAAGRKRFPGATDLSGIPQPVIAAINGPALGGGCEIALTCDFRFMAADAQIGLTEIRFGSLPIGGGTARLPRLVGLAAARKMIMTGDPIDAQEAERIGLADRVVEPGKLMDESLAFALRLAQRPSYAIRTAKVLLNSCLEADLPTALKREKQLARSMAGREELAAARLEAARSMPTYARIFAQQDGHDAAG
jgi:enoyl-CoA hydratase/carnithine racemase